MITRTPFVIIAGMMITACTPAENEPVAEESAPALAGEAEPFVMKPGIYNIEGNNVVYATTQVNADGTYVDTAEGQEVGRGTWTADGAQSCFDPDGDGPEQKERCWTNSPTNADGSFTTTRDDGSQSYTVRPVGGD